jgi:hypothetical protein
MADTVTIPDRCPECGGIWQHQSGCILRRAIDRFDEIEHEALNT